MQFLSDVYSLEKGYIDMILLSVTPSSGRTADNTYNSD